MRHLYAWTLVAAAVLAAAATPSPAAATAPPTKCPRLKENWYGDNRGACSG